MGSEPFPKVVMNDKGETKTVKTLHEQDAATKQGYFRALARIAETKAAAEAKAAQG